jgi:hypothetical protein
MNSPDQLRESLRELISAVGASMTYLVTIENLMEAALSSSQSDHCAPDSDLPDLLEGIARELRYAADRLSRVYSAYTGSIARTASAGPQGQPACTNGLQGPASAPEEQPRASRHSNNAGR